MMRSVLLSSWQAVGMVLAWLWHGIGVALVPIYLALFFCWHTVVLSKLN